MADYSDPRAYELDRQRKAKLEAMGLRENLFGGKFVCNYCDAVVASGTPKHLQKMHPNEEFTKG
jgi:hypothetical protein